MSEPNDRYDPLFRRYGAQYGVGWNLLKAQAIAESSLNPMAMSVTGARGLAQFMPTTWAEWGEGSPFDPEQAVRAQARYMAHLIAVCKGDVRAALAAYNWGIGHLRSGKTWPKETRDYVERVMALLRTL